jgi:hypothetical protein
MNKTLATASPKDGFRPLPCRLSHRLSRTFSRPASALGNRA